MFRVAIVHKQRSTGNDGFPFRHECDVLAADGVTQPSTVHRGDVLDVRPEGWAQNDGEETGLSAEHGADRLQRGPNPLQHVAVNWGNVSRFNFSSNSRERTIENIELYGNEDHRQLFPIN